MTLRGLALIFCVAIAAPAGWADGRAFQREDYERYFAPGRFASHSTYYASDGLFEVVSHRVVSLAGRHMLEQTTRSLDISDNYDTGSAYPFYKIEAQSVDQMLWDARRGAFVYEYSDQDFDLNDSIVWESHDTKIAISPGDRRGGEMHQFYRDADRRLGQDVKGLDAQYRVDVVGMWSWRCRFISNSLFEVECTATHLPSQREEIFYYRRMDLVG